MTGAPDDYARGDSPGFLPAGSPGPLLDAAAAKAATPEQRERWINAARDILTNEDATALAARPQAEKLSLAAASYGFWLQHIGNPSFEEGDWDRLGALTRAMPEEKKAALSSDLALQAKALNTLSLPDSYFRMEDRLHARAFGMLLADAGAAETLAAWSKVAGEKLLDSRTGLIKEEMLDGGVMSPLARGLLDGAGVTHDKVIGLMNKASLAMSRAWTEEMAAHGIYDVAPPMRVEPATPAERQIEFNVRRDAEGQGYYKAGERNPVFIDPRSAMHVAFHEPHHEVQNRIATLMSAGEALPDYMQQGRQIFRLLGDFGARNCPPSVLAASPQAEALANECYTLSRGEESALYQGHRAGIEINRLFMPDFPPKTESWFKAAPQLPEGLPPETTAWLRRFEGKAAGPQPATPAGPKA